MVPNRYLRIQRDPPLTLYQVTPPLLSVYHEARREALRKYRLSFQDESQIPFYFAPGLDTLFFADSSRSRDFDYFFQKYLETPPSGDIKIVR